MTKDETTGKGIIDLSEALGTQSIDKTAPIFVVATEEDGSVTGDLIDVTTVSSNDKIQKLLTVEDFKKQMTVFVDYYVVKQGSTISELQIDAGNFAGYYYVEASTLFRRQSDGVDMPAEITFPNVKIQSNFTFTMASSGDPSTFSFTMDAFPGTTYFDPTKKVLCVIQIIEDAEGSEAEYKTVMKHKDDEEIETAFGDSTVLKVKITTAATITASAQITGEGSTATATATVTPAIYEPAGILTATVTGNTVTGTPETIAGKHIATVTYSVNAEGLAAYNTANQAHYLATDIIVPEPVELEWTATAG